jgi:LysM repeat protein
MKILKIFGIVVGIHVFALILIFANPGCSSTAKPTPSTSDTMSKTDPSPLVSAPSSSSTSTPVSSAITFNPDAPAAPAPSSSGSRISPTRPNTPVAGVLVAEPVVDFPSATTYTVKSGDNLWTIAKRNNTTIAQLSAANNLPAGANLRPGQKLIIPGKPALPSAAATATGAAGSTAKMIDTQGAGAAVRSTTDLVKHTVKSGETLGGIARKYDVSLGDIAVANNISDPAKIRPGMELIIPGFRAVGTKNGKSSQKSATNGGAKSSQPAATKVDPFPSVQPEPTPTPLPTVPVIRLEDSSAPKQP